MKIKNWNKVKTGELLIVEWDDTVDYCGWRDDATAQMLPPSMTKNVGWFINNDKNNIRLSWSVNSACEKSISVIPIGCIKDVKKIKYRRTK